MFNFGSMFGSSRNVQSLSISELLSTPNVSLMRLLDQENFISQFRSASPSIKEFMNYKKFQQLIQLVTEVGDPFDKKRSFKFPLTAADLLSAENTFVYERLLPDEGVIYEEEKVTTSVQREIEQQIQDDDDDEEALEVVAGKQEPKQGQSPKEQKTETGEDEEFGEFVEAPVKKKKIVKIKEVVQTFAMVKKQYPALINKILDYFGRQINYTLTSYCCKILTTLLNKRTSKFLSKFFENEVHGANFLKHIGSRSVVEFLTRLFTIETKEYLENRLVFFKEVLKSLSEPQQLEVMSNISATLCESFEKLNTHLKTNNPCRQLQAYFNIIPELLSTTVNCLISEHEIVSVYSAPFIYQLLNSLPAELDDPSIDDILFKFVEGAIAKLTEAVEAKKSRLGVGRVKMMEVLNFILKRNKIRELLYEKIKLFPLLFSAIKLYPLNNIFHNEAFKFITNFLASEGTVTTQDHRFEDALINWLGEETLQEKARIENLKSNPAKGYAGHLVNLCKYLKQVNNPIIKEFTQSINFLEITKVLIEKEVILHERNLGGFSMRKNGKFQVMFSKQEILKQHAIFLSNARPAVFQTDPNDPLQNPALLEELQRQLDGLQVQSPPKTEEVIEQEKHKAQLIEQNEQHKSAFWKVHLDYDVNDLLNEL